MFKTIHNYLNTLLLEIHKFIVRKNTDMKFNLNPLFFIVLSIVTLVHFSCTETAVEKEKEKVVAFDVDQIDSAYHACEDFEQFAVGNWLKNNPVPESQSKWGSFRVLIDESRKITQELILEASKKELEKGSPEQLVGDFYSSAIDSIIPNELGYEPIKPLLDKIDNIQNHQQLFETMAEIRIKGSGTFFWTYVSPDAKNSTQNVLHIAPASGGLPSKAHYFPKSQKEEDILAAYTKHIAALFILTDTDSLEALKIAESVVQIETALNKEALSLTEARNAEKAYNKMSLDELQALSTTIDWKAFLDAAKIPDVEELIITEPNYFSKLDQILPSFSIEAWKNYMKWHLINDLSVYLSDPFRKQFFSFYSTTLSGVTKMKPRWKEAMDNINRHVGIPLGRIYAKHCFSESSKERVLEMINNISLVFQERLEQLDWMSDSTKAKAIEKLNKITYKIGYPDKWIDYSAVEIEPNTFVKNVMNLNEFQYERNVGKLGTKVDKKEWGIPAQTINAYYNSRKNEIVFPAGILQPPFYNADADDAINYGAIGAVIAHEFSHAFDDQGAKSDGDGNLVNWWTKEDKKRFEAKSKQLVEQFNQYEVVDGHFINGQLTLGENIADLAGVTLAYHALMKVYEGKEEPALIDGFDYKQRFFLGWAQVWHTNITDEEAIRRIKVDHHSRGRYRIIGPLSNMAEFERAFDCSSENSMVKPDSLKVTIW